MQASRLSKEVFSSRFDAEATTFLIRRAVSEPRELEPEPEEMAELRSRALKDVQTDAEVREAFHHGKSLRGKSAKAIEYQLKTNALMNLSRSEELADIRKYQREAVHVVHDEAEHHRLMDERIKNLTDMEKMTEPLVALSQEMKCFEKKSSNYFTEKRLGDLCRLLVLEVASSSCLLMFLSFIITPLYTSSYIDSLICICLNR